MAFEFFNGFKNAQVSEGIKWDNVEARYPGVTKDGSSASDNYELLVKLSTDTVANTRLRAFAQVQSDVSTYYAALRPNVFEISQFVDGDFSQLGSVTTTITAGAVYCIRLRKEDGILYGKYWEDIEPEPTGWLLQSSVSAITSPGEFGHGIRDTSGRVPYMSYGLNGATAPNEADTVGDDQYKAGYSTSTNGEFPVGWTARWDTATSDLSYESPLPMRYIEGMGTTWVPVHRSDHASNAYEVASVPSGYEVSTAAEVTHESSDVKYIGFFPSSLAITTDIETAILFKPSNVALSARFVVRGWEQAAGVSGPFSQFDPVGGTLQIREYPETDPGSGSSQLGEAPVSIGPDVWVWMRTRAFGNDLYAKMWEYGTSEPASWMVGASSTDHQGPENINNGFGRYDDSAQLQVAAIGIATNGDTAPLTEPVNLYVPTNLQATQLTETSARLTWE